MLAIGLGPTELLIVLLVVILLFGAARLPKLARSLGEAKREFDKGIDGREASALEPKATEPEPKASELENRSRTESTES